MEATGAARRHPGRQSIRRTEQRARHANATRMAGRSREAHPQPACTSNHARMSFLRGRTTRGEDGRGREARSMPHPSMRDLTGGPYPDTRSTPQPAKGAWCILGPEEDAPSPKHVSVWTGLLAFAPRAIALGRRTLSRRRCAAPDNACFSYGLRQPWHRPLRAGSSILRIRVRDANPPSRGESLSRDRKDIRKQSTRNRGTTC